MFATWQEAYDAGDRQLAYKMYEAERRHRIETVLGVAFALVFCTPVGVLVVWFGFLILRNFIPAWQ